MAEDEGEFGRINIPRKCWAPERMRPKAGRQIVREHVYIFAAVCPSLGEMTSLILPYADTEMMSLFLKQVSLDFSNYYIVMQVDGAGWHSSQALVIPENIALIEQPAYSPEVNPAEHIWEDIREKDLPNRAFESLDEVEESLIKGLNRIASNPTSLQSMTYFPHLRIAPVIAQVASNQSQCLDMRPTSTTEYIDIDARVIANNATQLELDQLSEGEPNSFLLSIADAASSLLTSIPIVASMMGTLLIIGFWLLTYTFNNQALITRPVQSSQSLYRRPTVKSLLTCSSVKINSTLPIALIVKSVTIKSAFKLCKSSSSLLYYLLQPNLSSSLNSAGSHLFALLGKSLNYDFIPSWLKYTFWSYL